MIPPSTPPGTKIICINADNIDSGDGWVCTPVGLILGSTYTVRKIERYSVGCPNIQPYGVIIDEMDLGLNALGETIGHPLERFRLPITLESFMSEPSKVEEPKRNLVYGID